MVINVNTLNKGYSVNLCQHPSTWCNSPSFPTHRVVTEEDVAATEDVAMEATHQAQSSNNLLNDTQQSVFPPPQPGIRPKTLSESHWDYPQRCTVEWKQVSESLNSSGEGKDSLYTDPTGEGKDSFSTVPSGEGKDSLGTVAKCVYPR